MGFKTCLYTVVSEVTYNDVGRSLPEAGLDTGRESVQNVWNLEMWDLVERKSLEKQNLCDLPPAFSNENLTSRYCMVLPELPRENSQPAIFTRANCADAAKLAFHVMGDGNYVLAVEYLFFGLPQMFEGNNFMRSLFLIRPRCEKFQEHQAFQTSAPCGCPNLKDSKANRLCHSTRWLNQRGTEKYFKPMDL